MLSVFMRDSHMTSKTLDMESSVEFLELIKNYKLSVEDCNKKVSDAHLEAISQSTCEHWKRLPSNLEMDVITVSEINRNQSKEEGKRLEFFHTWREQKGSKATYKQLVLALLNTKCKDDAEKVCEILKKSQPIEALSVPSASCPDTLKTTARPHDDKGMCGRRETWLQVILDTIFCYVGSHSDSSKQLLSIKSLDADTRNDLDMQLDMELQNIVRLFGDYVDRIHDCLQAKGVTTRDLSFKLVKESAFNHSEQKRTLVSGHETELMNTENLQDILQLLYRHYASFLNYDIFQFIVEKYQLDSGQKELQYPEHLTTYIEKHKISEFVKINPHLKKTSDISIEMILKLDIESTSRLAKLKKIKSTIARILGIKSAALQLVDIEEGCVEVTFLIPTPVAELLFCEDSILTEEQKREFQALKVVWLKCNKCKFEFEDIRSKETVASRYH